MVPKTAALKVLRALHQKTRKRVNPLHHLKQKRSGDGGVVRKSTLRTISITAALRRPRRSPAVQGTPSPPLHMLIYLEDPPNVSLRVAAALRLTFLRHHFSHTRCTLQRSLDSSHFFTHIECLSREVDRIIHGRGEDLKCSSSVRGLVRIASQ